MVIAWSVSIKNIRIRTRIGILSIIVYTTDRSVRKGYEVIKNQQILLIFNTLLNICIT